MGKVLGYARISTDAGQDITSQKTKLQELGAVVVFADVGNGSTLTGRDQLETAIRLLEPGDELLALHPDRLGRDNRRPPYYLKAGRRTWGQVTYSRSSHGDRR